jgi:hypothetical protein
MPKKIGILMVIGITIGWLTSPVLADEPASTHYKLLNYDFGGGGETEASSDGIHMQGLLGNAATGDSTSSAYVLNQGLQFGLQANVPNAPTFTNSGGTYDRLKFIIDNGKNPTDSVFAIAITDDDWAHTYYIKSDATIGQTLDQGDWLTYDAWGGATGRFVTGLAQETVYRIKVKAMSGKETESGWSPDATATTGIPSITFGIDHDTIVFDELESANSYTDTTKSTVITTSTNAHNGYVVYGHETAPLSFNSKTISDYVSPNSAPTLWSGTGFGYTTNDNSLIGGDANRFTSGGPKYAGFTTSAPGDPVADHVGPIVENPIENEQFTINYRVTAPPSAAAGSYKNTIMYVVVPQY